MKDKDVYFWLKDLIHVLKNNKTITQEQFERLESKLNIDVSKKN